MFVKLNYISEYFIQNNPEVIFFRDGLLLFQFPKLTWSGTEPNSWLPSFSFSCTPVSQQERLVFSV